MNLSRNAYASIRTLQNLRLLRFTSVLASDESLEKKKKGRRPLQPNVLNTEMSQYVSETDPEDFKYLNETLIKRIHQTRTIGDHDILRENKLSLWNYLQSYKDHFSEKSILIDRKTAIIIATAISNNTDAKCGDNLTDDKTNTNTFFVDGNGGLCRVTDEVINQGNKTKHVFSCYKIFEKDVNLVPVLQRARSNYLKSNLEDNSGNIISLMNINQFCVKYIHSPSKFEFMSEFYDRVLVNLPKSLWNVEPPIYTMFLTAKLGTLKYLTLCCLRRNECFTGEMSRGRPEFFFIVSPNSLAALTLGTWYDEKPIKRFSSTGNVLFNLLFEYKVLEELPRKSFIPWDKPSKRKSPLSMSQKIEASDNMYLVKARPKADIGLIEYRSNIGQISDKASAEPPSHWLEYFVHAICHEKYSTRFLPLLDKWHPSAAFYCVKKGLVPVYMKIGDFFESTNVEEKMIPIFNSLLMQKDLPLSSFGSMADAYCKGELRQPSNSNMREGETQVEYSDTLRINDELDEDEDEDDELY